MNSEPHQVADAGRQPLASIARASRRRLLATIAAMLAALGFPFFAHPESAEGKKGKHSEKNRNGKCSNSTTSHSPDGEERALVTLINDFRAQNDKGPLVIHEQLGAAAEYHSQDMASKNYFRHKLSNGNSPEKNIRCHGYSYHTYGENIAAGYEMAADTFRQWQNSPPHRKIMLEGHFKEIGVGRAFDERSKYDWYWTATFGSR